MEGRPAATGAYAWLGGALLLALTLGGLAGCLAPPAKASRPGPAYPAEPEAGPSLDVVVVRDGGAIRLVNRTPRTYENMQLWLNRSYSRPIRRVAIGEGPDLRLQGFVNQHAELYPIGSFLRPERSQKLVLAELYDPGADVMHKLTVQPPGTR